MALHDGRLIIGSRDKILRISDVGTGECLKELEGHSADIIAVKVQNNGIVSGDAFGGIIVQSLELGGSTDGEPGHTHTTSHTGLFPSLSLACHPNKFIRLHWIECSEIRNNCGRFSELKE